MNVRNIYSYFIVLLILSLTGCTGANPKKTEIVETDLEKQMIESYNEGFKALEEGDALFAAKNFNNVEIIYPQSVWAPRSILMAAYSYYSQDYYGDAIFELKRFIKNYPYSDDLSYAYFLMATCYYELIIDEKKDISPLLESKKNFNIIINNYPETDFALDARYKILLINNILASKELYVGKYYSQREKWIPAINRFKFILEEYNETEYVEESLHRLVEIHYKIGLENEAQKYASMLGYNYQSSTWYKESYKIFNKEYEDPIKKVKREKKNKIFQRFKSLFK